MALKVKAVERLLKFSKNENDPGLYRYVMKPELYSSLSQAKVIKEAALKNIPAMGINSSQCGNKMFPCWECIR